MSWESMPSDYAVLKMNETPHSGGDTLWASGYEVYDRLSTHVQKFLDGLTASHDVPQFIAQAERVGFNIHPGPRGAPENVGTHLTATHPLIRTNPVTGWKSVFSSGGNTPRINELTKQESDETLKYLASTCNQNHDIQVRFKWRVNDIAIWDNRSAYRGSSQSPSQSPC
jgi:alpha-ketoglutarate-dependent taurine dioxygenase